MINRNPDATNLREQAHEAAAFEHYSITEYGWVAFETLIRQYVVLLRTGAC